MFEDGSCVEGDVEVIVDGEGPELVAFTGATVTIIIDLIVDFNVVVLACTML